MSTSKEQRQPLSDKHRLIIIITAIVLVAVIAVSVTLGIMLKEPVKTPDDNDPSNNPSSSLPVKNGDFGIVSSEETVYPKSASNWTKYTYKAPSGSSHDFTAIESTENVVMGIVDTADDQWAIAKENLKTENVELGANPGQHSLPEGDKHTNSNVYMIATKNAYNASIMSDSVSVSATTSVKITVYINTSQLSEGGATVMIQKSSATPNAKEDGRYAYKYNIAKADGWQKLEFNIFNRKTSSQSVRVCVGIGNVYTDAPAEGIIYIDDITYETVTANDYRIYADEAEEGDTTYKIIEKEEETTTPAISKYIGLEAIEGFNGEIVNYVKSSEYVTKAGYSPFTDKDDFFKDGENEGDDRVPTGFGIAMISNNGSVKTPVGLQIAENIKLSLNENDYTVQDYNHVRFWVRTVSKNNNALAYANILVQRRADNGEWENLSDGDFTAKTSQDIKTDVNNGWTKYDIYLKPAKTETEIRIIFALGDIDGYESYDNPKYTPEGELYVTTPYFETISSSAYTGASSSTASKKYDLTGSSAETSVTNGSFSNISANTKQPSNWTPVFAGDNNIYLDGKGDIALGQLSTDKSAVEGSGVVDWKAELGENSGYVDDAEGRILKLVSNSNSSFGYVSSDITASAHSVYVFSVLAKVRANSVSAKPYFYLIEKGVDRDKAILAQVSNNYGTAVDGANFNQADSVYGENSGWNRYYIVYVTGDKDTTVRLALFNGSLTDADECAVKDATIYYDKVTMQTIGTYSMVEDEENKDAETYVVKFSASSDFADSVFAECEDVVAVVAKAKELLKNNANDSVREPTTPEWDEMKKIPEPDDGDDKNDEDETPAEKTDVDLALLFSILSSVLLVAALAVVIVIKIFRQRRKNA